MGNNVDTRSWVKQENSPEGDLCMSWVKITQEGGHGGYFFYGCCSAFWMKKKRCCIKISVFQLDKFFLQYGMILAIEKANGNRKRMAREYNLLNCVDILL